MLRHNNIEIPLLPGWEDDTQIVVLGVAEGDFRPNIVVSHEPIEPGESVEEFAARQLHLLEAALEGYYSVKEEVATFGPHTGFLREHEFEVNGQQLQQMQFYIPYGNEVYTFTATHSLGKFASSKSIFEGLFAGIVIDTG